MREITTKNGDGGMTELVGKKNVPKSDLRIQLLGDLDELTSYVGLVKSKIKEDAIVSALEQIQNHLLTVMAGVAEPTTVKHRLSETVLQDLEEEMAHVSEMVKLPEGFVLSGKNTLSAELDVTRAVARRAERSLSSVTVKFGTDRIAKKYLNRLSDYFYLLARYAESVDLAKETLDSSVSHAPAVEEQPVVPVDVNKAVVIEVMKRLSEQVVLPSKLNLDTAKALIERVEAYAKEQNLNAVIAVCGADGNPIAVHVMDNAFLVSFDVAMKKAYTSASVKMSTMDLSKLIQPGATFQGLDKLQGDKMVFFGGGVPLMRNGMMLGALGVSGGTGEEDDAIAQYGLKVFEELM